MGSPQDQTKLKKRATRPSKKKEALDSVCYVLITCGHPTEDGKMQVEMTYEGDPTLAAYLLENAQGFFEEESEEESEG